jgi:hypothetical protein
VVSIGAAWCRSGSSPMSSGKAPARGPPWTMVSPSLPSRGLGPLIFLLLKNISFSVIFQEIYIEAHRFHSNYNLDLSFGFCIISNPRNLHFSPYNFKTL